MKKSNENIEKQVNAILEYSENIPRVEPPAKLSTLNTLSIKKDSKYLESIYLKINRIQDLKC